ncbi:MAG: penicillin-binding transpeptidase domain-containing protein [Actinomycetota bacterium]|nr:penicillin-binding transpeptidase domain-containing protein [Actinomycetota bacterium]
MRSRSTWLVAGVAVLVVLVVIVVAVRRDREAARLRGEAGRVVAAYLSAWSAGDAAGAARQVVPASSAAAQQLLAATREQLHATATTYERVGRLSSSSRPGSDYRATVMVAGLGTARWNGRVPLTRVGAGWKVAFAPAVVHPALVTGGRFAYTRDVPARGRVLAAGGESLTADPDLSVNVRGQVVPAKAGGPLPAGAVPGDDIGVGGLEEALNPMLAGQAGGTVAVLDPSGRSVATLLTMAKTDGTDVRTTLDLRTQRAAEAAVAGMAQAGALVAVDTATGRVLAAVNNPPGGFARALAGKGPPGSTFKIVTSAAALIAGVPPSTVLDCSATTVVNGRTFKNAENGSAGPIGWQQAFAQSCNTWFVQLQAKVPLPALASAAALFGFAADGEPGKAEQQAAGVLPFRSFGGSFPAPRDRSQAAGQSIGQDQVLASPLQMASVAAAVADGTWRRPVVTGAATVTHPLPPEVVSALRSFMAAVPAPGGTAAKSGLPAGTFGKTGTAETAASNADPKQTDSWFVGYRGSVAFAVEFDRAGFGADVAAPAAARFLRAIG